MHTTNNTSNETQKQDDFIMLPTNDVCFAGLMENPIVRKGFCAAVMRVHPDEIGKTELLPTHLHREYADDKLGILDVRVRMKDGAQINMEMQVKYFEFWDERALFYLSRMFSKQLKRGDSYEKLRKCIHVSILDFIRFPEDEKCYRTIHFRDDATNEIYNSKRELQLLELKKIPKNAYSGEDIVNWMRFFNSKNKEEFESMAQTNEYLGEAYEALQRMSADDKNRLEYEARDKALKDYNTQINSAQKRGIAIGEKRGIAIGEKRGITIGEKRGITIGEKRGIAIGEKNGIELACKVIHLHSQGLSNEEIASKCNVSAKKVQEILTL